MIGAAVAAALPTMRAHALSLMSDKFTVDRPATGFSEVEQKSVSTWVPVVAVTPCHVETSPAASRVLVTGESASPETPLVKTLHSVSGVQPDDRLTVAGHPPFWVTSVALDDPTHPVELLIQCRRLR